MVKGSNIQKRRRMELSCWTSLNTWGRSIDVVERETKEMDVYTGKCVVVL